MFTLPHIPAYFDFFFLLNLLYIGLGGHPVQINPVHSSLINIYPWFKKKKMVLSSVLF